MSHASTFGDELRAERERQGLTLESLCASTRVQQRYLVALEQGDYTVLPGGVFRKGIVRAYLTAAGLPEQDWLPRFEHSLEEHARTHGMETGSGSEAWAAFAENVRRNRVGARHSNGLRWAGVLLFLLLLAAAGCAAWYYLLRPKLQPW